MNKLIILLLSTLLLASCGGGSSSGGAEQAAETPDAMESQSCALGRFEFRTLNDGKFHFDANFGENGVISYNLTGGGSGTYKVDGDMITYTGPLGNNGSELSFTWRVTIGSGCDIKQFRGNAVDGKTPMSADRI